MSRSLFQNLFAASVLALGLIGCAESLPTDSSDPSGAQQAESSDEQAQLFPGLPGLPGAGGRTPTTSAAADDEPVGTPVQAGAGTLPPVTSLSAKGPYAVTIDQRGGGNTWIFHPTELGKDGVKHPIFVWGTGATSTPTQYRDHFNHLASHGFVIISPNTGSVNGNLMKQALNWIIAQNSASGSKFNGKLDTSNIAMGGHSLGSVSTFDAEATETRLKTSIHIAGGSFDGRGSSKVKTPTAYMCGGSGDIAKAQCDVDFQNVRAGGNPTYYAVMAGTGHVDAARKALPAMTAWLRWHLAGEVERKAEFSPGGEFTKGIFSSAKTKNWN